jgi:hypothetical protein
LPTEKAAEEIISAKINGLLDELFMTQDIKEALTCMKEISDNGGEMEVAVKQVFCTALDKKGTNWALVAELLASSASNGILQQDVLTAGVKQHLDQLEEQVMDAPLAPQQTGKVLGHLIAAESINLQEIAHFIRTADLEAPASGQDTALVGSGNAAKVIAALMLEVSARKDEGAARTVWQASGAEWKAFLPQDDRDSEEAVSLLGVKLGVASIVV